jgi:hypothetical protein
MNTKEAFYKSALLGEKIKEEEKKVRLLVDQMEEIMNDCPHEIVFKYTDNHPRKMCIDGKYFCPACAKTIQCIHEEDRLETPFKNSRVIPLTNLSLEGSKEVYFTIRNEVFEHMKFYYNPNNCDEALILRMESLLEDKQTDYSNPAKLLEKYLKK